MGLESTDWILIGVATALFLAGLFLGLALARGGQGARARARRLEGELRQAQDALVGYQDQVGKHFVQTSDLFSDLTRQYSAVWDHLAEGARSLCAERGPAIGRGFTDAPLLLTKTPAPSDEPIATEPPAQPEGPADEVAETPIGGVLDDGASRSS